MINLLYRIRFWFYKLFNLFRQKIKRIGGDIIFVDNFLLNLDQWRIGEDWGVIHPEYSYQYSSWSSINLDIGQLELSVDFNPKIVTHGGVPFSSTYSFGKLSSMEKFNKGIFEIRCKLSNNGWDAVWLSGGGYEIDIVEIFKNRRLSSSVHWDTKTNRKRKTKQYRIPGGWHVYTLIWDNELTFKFDGLTIRKEKININADMSLKINTGIEQDTNPEWVFNNNQPFLIDYIRVYATD